MIARSLSEASSRPGTSQREHGSIRLYSADGERSTVATLTLATTAEQIAQNYKVDCLYLQTGNFRIRKLETGSRPLEVYTQYIRSIGFDMEIIRNYSSQETMRNIIAFYLGRPTFNLADGVKSEMMMTECDVRRGRLLPKWSRKKCILYNGGVRIFRGSDEGEVIPLVNKRVDIYDSRRGKCLRIHDSVSTTLFLFDDSDLLHHWLYKCQQNVQSTSTDWSDRRLTLLPENLFTSPETIRKLNLRKNSLTSGNPEDPPQIGFLDDLARLVYLTSLDLSFNGLSDFPLAITELGHLESANFSSNQIDNLPADIKKMKRLIQLDVSNNRLTALPSQLVECTSLVSLNLAFNHFKKIPLVLTRLDMMKSWLLAGNYIERVENHESDLEHLQKLDLRRNNLESTFRLPVGSYDQLTHIDLRDNQKLSVVFLTNAPALKVVLCSRLQLTSIHLNGQSLTHLFVDHNLLDSLVVMPIPARLQLLDVSHNLFETLPDWVCDLPSLTALKANHNRLVSLPSRIFCMQSLRLLCALNNAITRLPSTFEDPVLETVLLQNNSIETLPVDFLKGLPRLRQLNVSFNGLRSLPRPSSNVDWNKLQVLRAAHNNLDETVVPIVILLKRLKVLDLSNNKLRYFDDSALDSFTLLEDLNISSNLISSVSAAIPQLPVLTHFRAHSNVIQSMPDLSQSLTLQVVDLSSNQISFLPPSMASAPALRSLDVSCNPLMQIDSGTISRSRRKPVTIVDVGAISNKLQFGFSDTTGNRNRLCIRRICKKSVFGLIDGGSNYDLPKGLMNSINEQLEDMTDVDERKLVVASHLQLGEVGEQLGASILLAAVQDNSMRLVSCGTVGVAVLGKGNLTRLDTGCILDEEDYLNLRKNGLWLDEDNLINGITSCPRQLGQYHLHPAVSPNPVVIEGTTEGIDTIVISSKALWEHLTSSEISRVVTGTVNPQVAAKRLQDALQSCDYQGNSSVIVIRLPKPEIKFSSTPSLRGSEHSLENNIPLQIVVPREPAPIRRHSPIHENYEQRNELDSGGLTGKQLYEKILAEEVGQRSPSSSSCPPPPDPQSDQEIPPEMPTPTPRSTVLPSNYREYNDNQNYSLRYLDEGQYSVSENTRRFDESITSKQCEEVKIKETGPVKKIKETVISPSSYASDVTPSRLSVIREISESSASELAIDEPHSFSHYSQSNTLTPMEDSLSSRYRFEYARSNIQENLKLSRSSTLDL